VVSARAAPQLAAPAEFALHGSRILVGAGLLARCGAVLHETLPGHRIALVSDETVAPLYAARVAAACAPARVTLFTIPAGEASKTRKQWSRLTDEILDAGFGRDSAIIAVGGGVVGDLAGFVAATYMRGIPYVQIPTSLLAMIDASIGGKTGVDTRAGKNLVGAFHHPALVIADPRVLATLPPAQLRNGLAEAVKHAVIASRTMRPSGSCASTSRSRPPSSRVTSARAACARRSTSATPSGMRSRRSAATRCCTANASPWGWWPRRELRQA
jgi:3-dehydroquinate synthetase